MRRKPAFQNTHTLTFSISQANRFTNETFFELQTLTSYLYENVQNEK